MKNFKIIRTGALRNRLDEGPITYFWNVLTDEYFTGELIPGSRRVPLDEVGREVQRLRLAKDAEIVVYCSGPDCPQSTSAAEKLARLGFQNVSEYENGLSAWKEAGQPVERVVVGSVAD